MRQSFQPIDVFLCKPYSGILSYPRRDGRTVRSRLAELEKMGVTEVSFSGSSSLAGVNVLGKGHAGIVVLARMGDLRVALKIRRLDSGRYTMKGEEEMLRRANGAGVGPKLIAAGRNLLAMEYMGGMKIGEWFEVYATAPNQRRVKLIVKKIIRDCYKLDREGLDHGELNRISKHVIVGRKTAIVDFESASVRRRVSNVTSATQGIFIGSGIAKKIGRVYRLPKKEKIISALREYKASPDTERLNRLFQVLKL